MDFEKEILDLRRRVGDLEGALGILTGQLRLVHPELLSLQAENRQRFDRADRVLENVDVLLNRVSTRMNGLELQVWSLRDELPDLIRGAIGSADR